MHTADKGIDMNTLYDSDSFVVVHMLANAPAAGESANALPQLQRHGFEIVDKRTNKEVYLDGSWAEMFQQRIVAWQDNVPTQEEVESTLESYTGLARHPMTIQ